MARILFLRDGDNSEGHEVAGFHELSAVHAARIFSESPHKYSSQMPTANPFPFGSDRHIAKHVALAISSGSEASPFDTPGYYLFSGLTAEQCAARLGFPERIIAELCAKHTRRHQWRL